LAFGLSSVFLLVGFVVDGLLVLTEEVEKISSSSKILSKAVFFLAATDSFSLKSKFH
jgi:hypothetical protein